MKIKLSHLLLGGAVAVTTAAFTPDGGNKGESGPPTKFIDPANMDLSVKPGDDFFEYANGTWLKQNAIPAKETRWGSFNILRQENTDKLLTLLNEVSNASATQPKGSLIQRVGDLYASGMDSLAIEKKGYEPIKADLQRIAAISDLNGVIHEMIMDRVNGDGSPLFRSGVGADSKHPNVNIVDVSQGGTTLPDRDFYLFDNPRNQKIRDAYTKYITTLFTLTGTSTGDAAKNAATILTIETALAKAQLSRVEMRDPNKTYNKYSVADFDKMTPHLNWTQLLPEMKLNKVDTVNVSQPDFFKAADNILATTPVADWKVFLEWNMLKGSASALSSPFVKANFEFSSVMSGQKVLTPRNERMSGLVDGSLGELLGQLYVEKYFTPAAKEYMVNLVNNLKGVLGARIKRLDWMREATKQRALAKLNAFSVKIGYPDRWQPYIGLNISRNDYYANLKSISKWRYNYNISQLGKPVDKARWGMTPPTVNASYSPTTNGITFPAGILQFPFFDFKADDAVNYGGIGAVIGHEMTHGFDDQGRQYDADGTLRDWWTKDDADKFISRADQVVNQYNAFTVVDTMHVNGKLTLGVFFVVLGGLFVVFV